MVEPLPRWAKGFLVLLAAIVLAVVFVRILDDGLGHPQPANWRVSPSAELESSTRRVPVIVHETSCASGRYADGRIVAEVTYDADSVLIDIEVRPFGGDQDCQGNPDTPFVVELAEPLGDRQITGERWPTP